METALAIHTAAHYIPNAWDELPFVNDMRAITERYEGRVGASQLKIVINI